ncbi:MAG: hypothetical protein ACHBN1_11700 [Heteroscytonema crispum UTEX LB 1556]
MLELVALMKTGNIGLSFIGLRLSLLTLAYTVLDFRFCEKFERRFPPIKAFQDGFWILKSTHCVPVSTIQAIASHNAFDAEICEYISKAIAFLKKPE